MGNLIQSNISFTVDTSQTVGGFSHKRTNGMLVSNNSTYNISKKQTLIDLNIEDSKFFYINAIDINWNIAELTNSDISTGGSLTIKNSGELLKLIDDMQKEIYVLTDIIFNKISNFYWYVGVISPTDPTNANENTGNNKWTELTSTPSVIQIDAGIENPSKQWYVAIPHSYGFQAYDSTGAAPDEPAYSKSVVTISGIQYDLFTGAGMAIAVNGVFKK